MPGNYDMPGRTGRESQNSKAIAHIRKMRHKSRRSAAAAFVVFQIGRECYFSLTARLAVPVKLLVTVMFCGPDARLKVPE